MAETIKIEEAVALPHSCAAVWPLLAKTDWINRSIGLPPVHYEITPLREGGSQIQAHARLFGLSLAWQELPFEWSEPMFYQVRRIFQGGPLAEGLMGLRFDDTDDGCRVDIFAHFNPRNYLGDFLARRIIGPKSVRDMRQLVRQVGEFLRGHQAVVMPGLTTTVPNQNALELGLARLKTEHVPVFLSARLQDFLETTPDVELTHIRPFALARKWRMDRWEVLKLFLQATRAGLLNLNWEVLCPNCRSTRMPRNHDLRQLRHTAHCEVCNIKYDAAFDKSVELKFSVNPALRPCDDQTFCLVGPGGKPHIHSQMTVEPGQTKEWILSGIKHSYRLRSLQVREPATVWAVQSALTGYDAEIICSPDGFKLKIAPIKEARARLFVTNPNAYPVQIVLEEGGWDEDILTAARVTNWQEFRDIFSTDVISPNEQVSVGSQVVLFTDLRGSTAIYTNIGDAPAYVLVRDHFGILQKAISSNHGGIVKTIGDAVMAVFSTLNEALTAAQEMHRELAKLKVTLDARLQLKSALHVGPCLVVNANDRLDFFGSTVNLAARLVEESRGDDLVVTDEVYQQPDAQAFVSRFKIAGEAGATHFTGFPASVKIWRLPLLG
jgi:class 3 adenylate cyclase